MCKNRRNVYRRYRDFVSFRNHLVEHIMRYQLQEYKNNEWRTVSNFDLNGSADNQYYKSTSDSLPKIKEAATTYARKFGLNMRIIDSNTLSIVWGGLI
jgi:hypothetical protein